MKKEISENASITANSKQVEVLKEHFPNCFDKDGLFQPHKLEEIVKASGADISREGYSLNWLGKSYARLLANENVRTLLAGNKEHNAKTENANSENLLIQGDNLEVLKHLKNAYREKVKMIYIDPPYNTGSDGFVYADDRKFTPDQLSHLAGIEEDEAKRILEFTQSKSNSHSAWLTFMFPRLYIARELLRDDGVIFISIDDNEQAQLKMLCDEVFGEENFVSEAIWKSGRTASSHFTNEHEYIVCYSKNINLLPFFKYNGEKSIISDRAIKKYSLKNPYDEIAFPAGIRFESSDKLFPSEFGGSEKTFVTKGELRAKDGKLANPVTLKCAWAMSDMIRSWLKGNEIYDQKGQKVEEFYFKSNGVLQYIKSRETIHPKSVITDFTTKHGTTEVESIMEFSAFSFPKPTGLISELASYITDKTQADTIFDFFSGSGTTAHAVMALNAEDGGNRKCISVQLDESTDEKSEAHKAGYKTIFEITRERIKRAAVKIKQENPDAKCDFGFKEFKTIDPFQGYLDEAETLDQYEAFEADKLSDEERGQLMLTWQAYDGLPLSMDLNPIDLASYTAHQGDELLYFMDAGLQLKHIVNLLERIDNDKTFAPRKLIVLGQLLESKAKREISEAISSYNNRKGIELTLDIRF